VVIHPRSRRFFCDTTDCSKVTFAQQIAGLTARHARHSVAAGQALTRIAVATGGRARELQLACAAAVRERRKKAGLRSCLTLEQPPRQVGVACSAEPCYAPSGRTPMQIRVAVPPTAP
jgi:hypothetical protein